jgi:hypothetical protein
MDPVTAAIIAAVLAGAAAGLTDTAKTAIADAYNGLKGLLKRKFGEESEVVKAATGVESKPDSAGRKETLKEEVAATKADQDADVLAAAQALLEKVKATPGGSQIIQTVTGNQNIVISGTANTVTFTTSAPAADEEKKRSRPDNRAP